MAGNVKVQGLLFTQKGTNRTCKAPWVVIQAFYEFRRAWSSWASRESCRRHKRRQGVDGRAWPKRSTWSRRRHGATGSSGKWEIILMSDQPRQHIKKQRYYFANKGLSGQSYGFTSSHVWMWELDHKESWALKNWLLNCGIGEYSWESLGLQEDPSSPS